MSLSPVMPRVAVRELVPASGAPDAEVLAAGSMRIANGLAGEENFDHIAAGQFVSLLPKTVQWIQERHYNALSTEAKTALLGCAAVAGSYLEQNGSLNTLKRRYSLRSDSERNDLALAKLLLNDYSFALRLNGRSNTEQEQTLREQLPLFGAALGVITMDLAKQGSPMDASARLSTGMQLRSIGARFLGPPRPGPK